MINENLKLYKAKSDNTTIYEHTEDLINILNQLKNIHNINDEEIKSIIKSCEIHDIGKAIGDFQNNIESTHRKLRHEYLSASYLDLTIQERLSILLHHKDLEYFLSVLGNEYYDGQLDEISNKLNCDFINIESFIKDIVKPRKQKILKDKELILQLGYLKLCDHIASAEIKEIEGTLNARETFNFEKYKSVQQKVIDMKIVEDIILIAPTGVGKTETSLLWSDKIQNELKNKRIFYILPYTASINALYKRFKTQGINVGVLHSKIKSLLNREDDIDNIQEELQLFKKNIKQVTICTIFQIIKATFGSKNWEMLLAQFKDSIFIIDEIHCFDTEQFAYLIESLKWLKEEFNISICIMSASIPTCMLNIIKDRLNINKVIYAEKEDYLLRHKINYKNETILDDVNYIFKNIEQGKKTLICVNNIETSQMLYSMIKDKYSDKTIKLIHGKFNAKDRTLIENGIDDVNILIGTQAIEVSLDIDYDIMFSEIAPFDSLLQRFGRVNRKGRKGISDIYIYNEYNKSIYDDNIINKTLEQLINIVNNDNGVIYEDKTISYLDNVYPKFDIYKYNEYSNKIKHYVIDNLRVGYYNDNVTDSLIEKNISILPSCLLDEYIHNMNNHKYIEANELFLNIKQSTYNMSQYKITYNEQYNIYIPDTVYDDRGLTKEEYSNFL